MNKDGFTVIELMVVLAVFSILSALAVPSFKNILKQQEVNGQINNLVAMVYLARSEAIKRNQVVTVCKSSDKQGCGGNWTDGWLMFVDLDGDGDRSAGEYLIGSGEVAEEYELTWSGFGSQNYIRFLQNGLTLFHNGSFVLCPESGDVRLARAVFISKTARARTSKDSDDDGVDEKASGDPLSC